MATLSEQIVQVLGARPGLTDREITDVICGPGTPQQRVNRECHSLESKSTLVRRKRADGLIGNYRSGAAPVEPNALLPRPSAANPSSSSPPPSATESSTPGPWPATVGPYAPNPSPSAVDEDPLSEDALKRVLAAWLEAQGWQCRVAWGKTRGIDIVAIRGAARWVIEVKGRGSRPQMRGNYFVAILGETLQRMDDPNAGYSIGLPDLAQFRRLWERLPRLAKTRTGISALFVDAQGHVLVAD